MKHLAFQTEKTHRRERPQQLVAQIGGKVISPKVRKQVKRSEKNSDMTNTTSRTNRAPSDSNCIEIHAKQSNSASRVRPSKLVVKIAQIEHGYTNKTLEIRYYVVNSVTREISRNDRKLPKIRKIRENNKTEELLKFRYRQG